MKVIWVPSVLVTYGGLNPAAVSALAQQAASYIRWPATRVEMSPSTPNVTVNLQTWLWINSGMWHSISATATAGAVSATATATPSEVIWQMGDSETVTCTGAGTPWTSQSSPDQASDCSYIYPQDSSSQPNGTYTVTTTVYWHVTWTSQGAPGGGDLGLIPSPSTQTAVHVQEVHAINRGPSN